MRQADEIRRKFFEMFTQPDAVFPAVVTEINENDFSCTVQTGDVFYYDVRLRGLINPDLKGFAFIPKKESAVLCARIAASNELFVAMFTEIDKITFSNENIKLLIDNEAVKVERGEITAELTESGVIFNGGTYGGIIKIQELTDKINTLIDAFNDHTHIITSGSIVTTGTATTQTCNTPVNVPQIKSPFSKLQKGEYENEKVKH